MAPTRLLLLLLLLATQADNARASKDRVKRAVRHKVGRLPRVWRPSKTLKVVGTQIRGHSGGGVHPTSMTPDLNFEELETDIWEGCDPPEVMFNGRSVPPSSSQEFANLPEVEFLGIIGPAEQKRVCKIKCLNGIWVGPLCTIEEDHSGSNADSGPVEPPLPRPCSLTVDEPNLVISYQGQTMVTEEGDTLVPHGGTIQLRCTEVGILKFVGNSSMTCHNGQWSSDLPYCVKTTLQHNFSIQAPPSVLYTLASGDVGVTEMGELVVLPGSIVHLDCLFQRQHGNPKWTWLPTRRQSGNPKWRPPRNRRYVSEWANTVEERSWKYRLSMNHAGEHNSGIYRCTTPRGLSNEIKIIIKDVECPPIESVDPNRVMALEGTKMNNKARFACVEGNNMVGAKEIFCTASARWSADIPLCHTIQCPPLPTDHLHLKIESQNRTYATKVYFSCPTGFHLIGPTYITCLNNETWSEAPPVCEAVTCKKPTPPTNGRVLDSGRYQAGDFLRYTCNTGHIIVGEPVTVCNDQGEWSQPLPTCKPACEFPGEPANGQVIPTKFHYDIGEIVSVGCTPGFRLQGSQRLRCTLSGHWSVPLPQCRHVNS